MLTQQTMRVVIPLRRDGGASNNNVKGKLFEKLVECFLSTQSYDIVKRLRDVGSEIDLLCKSRLDNSVVIVECKAHERVLGSEVISKIFSDAIIHSARLGLIFAISELGSEARGRLENLSAAHGAVALCFFSSHDLAELLLKADKLSVPPKSKHYKTSSQVSLALFEHQMLWIVVALDSRAERPVGLLGWNAETGREIASNEAPDLTDTDFPHAELPWLNHEATDANVKSITQPIVEVIPGDEWSDYRPSRPNDFVGRVALIEEVGAFFEAIKSRETPSRIFGIKGRSGWGKSSLAVKLAHDMPRKNVSVFPVDCRAASTSIYADMVLAKALNKAAFGQFNIPLFAPEFDYRANPFETPSVSSFLDNVSRANGIIVIIFDQFEAIIHRAELRVVFERMRELALHADELRGPLVIGFSWKTDGTVSSDNPGYHLWHSLSDRRRDFEIDRFSRDDADQFMSLALKSAKTSLPRSICQFILEHYAGYPWLLKKLIKHCVDDAKRADRRSINMRSYFDISSLFENDLQELNNSDTAALRFIAREAPVELHIAEEKCGYDTISSLMDRRLLIKSGSQLSLYWDVFRDYVINGQVPQLPNTYIPTISVRKLRSMVRYITSKKSSTYTDLASALGISPATADNAVRDLVNMGLVEANRLVGEFTSNCSAAEEATRRIVDFLKSHSIFRRVKTQIEAGSPPHLSVIEESAAEDYAFLSIDARTLKTYTRKILVYCLEFGLLTRDSSRFYVGTPHINIMEVPRRDVVLSDDDLFRAAAPPQRVMDLLDALAKGECGTLLEATKLRLRNAVFAASRLGLVEHREGRVRPLFPLTPDVDRAAVVAEYAGRVEPVRSALADVDVRQMSSYELGVYLSDSFELNWSPASCRRYGFALRDWFVWLEDNTVQ